jgi:hypothetical protein
MHLIAVVLAALAACGFCTEVPHHPGSHNEPAFGIEFSIDNIMISFVPPGGYEAISLAAVEGDTAYQWLMESYFELCSLTHASQTPPWTEQEFGAMMAREYETRTILRPDLGDWYDWSQFRVDADIDAPQILTELDEHSRYTDIAILANAVRDVRRAAVDVLASQFNITMPDRPFVSIAAPSIIWTAIEPGLHESDLSPACAPSSDRYPSTWHHVFVSKMSDAIHRADFRREVIDNIDSSITYVNECADHTSPITPAGHAAFWNLYFDVWAPATPGHWAADYVVHDGGTPAIVAELTSLALSLWTHQQGPLYSPWSIKPFLSPNHNTDLPAYMLYPDDPAWSDVVCMIQRQRESLAHFDGEVLDVYLTGDAWEDEMVGAFRSYLHDHKVIDLNVEFRGMFAGSDGAASMARRMLDGCMDTQVVKRKGELIQSPLQPSATLPKVFLGHRHA